MTATEPGRTRGALAWSLPLALATSLTLGTGGAFAADLGGNCCADLEERVAELEATTVRKGQRRVNLTVSGQVSHVVMYWDDGTNEDVYIADSGNFTSRFRFVGTAAIRKGLTAGFLYEFQFQNNSTSAVNQQQARDGLGLNGDDLGGNVSLRDQTLWLKDDRLGTVKLGHGSTPTDNLILIDLSNSGMARTPDISLYGGGFVLRNKDGSFAAGTTWAPIVRGNESWDTSRRNHIMYETPTFAGFSIGAAVAEDNFWDVALKYAGEFNGVRFAFGIGYRADSEFNNGTVPGFGCAIDCQREENSLLGSASIMHVPSGLFLTGAAGTREHEGTATKTIGALTVTSKLKDNDFWYLAGGIARNWTGLGSTVLYVDYSEHTDAAAGTIFNLGGAAGVQFINSSEVTHWSVGVHQHIDSAAMDLFLTYKNYEADLRYRAGRSNFDDLRLFMGGARMRF